MSIQNIILSPNVVKATYAYNEKQENDTTIYSYSSKMQCCCLQTQMRKGFQRVEESIDDIALDSPLLKTAFIKYKQQAEQEGWLV